MTEWQRNEKLTHEEMGVGPFEDERRPVYEVRGYTPPDKKWPILVLTIWEDTGRDLSTPAEAFKVTCAWKKNSKSWWEDRHVPLALAGDLADMLKSVTPRDVGSPPPER